LVQVARQSSGDTPTHCSREAVESPRWKPDNRTVLTVAPLLAETIMNVFEDDSVSAIFGGENRFF
jgi:hypothetical protein